MDGEPVAAGVGDRVHRGHLVLVDPRAKLGHLLQLVSSGIIEVVAPRLTVAAGPDHEFVLVVVLAVDPEIVALEFGRELVVELLGLGIEDAALFLPAGPGDHGEHFALLAVAEPAHVVVGVLVDQPGLLLAGQVPFHHGILVAAVQVVAHIQVGIVEGEEHGVPAVLEAGAHVLREGLLLRGAVVVHLIDPIGLRGHADDAVVVRDPALEVVPAVVVQRLQLAAGDVAQVGVEYLRVALVHLDEDHGLHPWHVVQPVQCAGAHAALRGQRLHVAAVDAGAEYDEVLVAIDVAAVHHAITLPEVAADVAHRIARHLHGLICAHLLHEDVHAVLPRRAVAHVLAVRADLEARLLRVPEEVLHVDPWRRGGGGWLVAAGGEQGC